MSSRSILFYTLASIHFFACAIFAQVQPQTGFGRSYQNMTIGKDRVEIPITLASTQILVDDVFVNGEGPFRFMLDTGGMGGGRVDSSLVEKLGLEKSGDAIGSDGTGRQGRQMAMHQLESIEFAGLTFEDVRVLSRDYNARGAAVRGHIDGILGFALFKELLLTIDYSKRKLVIEKGTLPAVDGKTILSTNQNNVPGIELSIDGKKYSAHFDTGAMGWISVSDDVAKDLKFIGEPVTIGQARTVTGAFDIKRAKLDGDVMIGSNKIHQPFIVIGIPLQTVNIGGHILRDFVVTYDQDLERIRIVPAEKVRLENAPESSRLPMQPTSVPMESINGHPTIEAMINGEGPFRFLFDTGAGVTLLDPSLVKELGLKPTGTTKIGDPSEPEAVETRTFILDSFGVGSVSFEKVNAVEFGGLLGQEIKGVIGLPTFYDALLAMDYPNQTLTLSRGTLGPGNGNVAFQYDMDNLIALDSKIGNQTIKTHLDSGNMGTVMLPLKLAEKLPLKDSPKVIGRARSASGSFDIHGAQLEGSIEFAGVKFDNPMIHFNDRFDWGNIGSQLLKDYVLTIDQVNQRLNLTKVQKKNGDANRAKPAAKPRLGVAFGLTGDGNMVVHQVAPGGLGEKFGLTSGDVILKVNGKPVSDFESDKRTAAFSTSPLDLTIERDGKEKKIKIEF